jgi:hypothetical protein
VPIRTLENGNEPSPLSRCRRTSWCVKSTTECPRSLNHLPTTAGWVSNLIRTISLSLIVTYPSEPMTMWPISRRVNAPENDDASLLDRATQPLIKPHS